MAVATRYDRTMDRQSLEAEQQALNRQSRDYWDAFADHRRRVTQLTLRAAVRHEGRLCVLGAGNCNDLSLEALREGFSEVHLVDLDQEALAWGVARQGLSEDAGLRLHGGSDLARLSAALAGWTSSDRRHGDDALVQALAEATPSLPPGPFDVVLSSCLLSQLVTPVIEALGPDHPRLPDALRALRHRHLAIMADLLTAQGTALLVSDLVSSDTRPELAQEPATDLTELMLRSVQEQNFFSGTNPYALLSDLQDDPAFTERIDRVALVEPWIWSLGAARRYLVYAVAMRRR